MNKMIASIMIFVSSTAIAAENPGSSDIQSLVGTYDLVEQKINGEIRCFDSIAIDVDGQEALFRDPGLAAYGPDVLFRGDINGAGNETSGNHGEAGTSRSGVQTVTFKRGILTFTYKGTVKFLGIPSGKEEETLHIQQTKAADHVLVQYSARESAFGIGKTNRAQCLYRRR